MKGSGAGHTESERERDHVKGRDPSIKLRVNVCVADWLCALRVLPCGLCYEPLSTITLCFSSSTHVCGLRSCFSFTRYEDTYTHIPLFWHQHVCICPCVCVCVLYVSVCTGTGRPAPEAPPLAQSVIMCSLVFNDVFFHLLITASASLLVLASGSPR